MGTTLMIEGTASYLQQLWKEDQFDGAGDFYWSASAIMNPDIPREAEAIADVEAAEKDEFRKVYMKSKGATDAGFDKAWGNLNDGTRALRDGDAKGGEYEGCRYVAARATKGKQAKPVVLDRNARKVGPDGMLLDVNGQPSDTPANGTPYAGCKIIMQIEIWAQYDGKYKRTNCTLLGVQFKAGGDAFGGGKSADLSKFQNLGDQGDDEEEDGELAGLA